MQILGHKKLIFWTKNAHFLAYVKKKLYLCSRKGLKSMSEPYTYNPSAAESRNIFTASCVESVASALQQPAEEIYRRMARVNLIDEYIIPCYEVLHSESRENVTKDIIYTLELWEQKQGI